jgi:hypothetical protein
MPRFKFASASGVPDFDNLSIRDLLSPPEAQGPEGRKLLEILEAAQRHMSRVMTYGGASVAPSGSAVVLAAGESLWEAIEAATNRMLEGVEYPSDLIMPRNVIRRHRAKLIRHSSSYARLGLSAADLNVAMPGEEDGD